MANDHDHKATASDEAASQDSWLARALTRRVPIWLVLGAFFVVVGSLLLALFVERRSSVELGPAVGAAERIEVQMTLCNRDVDRLDLNPRHEELGLEGVLREEGAGAVNVEVDRRDCPRPKGSDEG